MLKVIEILPDGSALVSTEGLFRILIQPEGRIAGELLDADEAQSFLDGYNNCRGNRRAEAVTYASQIASN